MAPDGLAGFKPARSERGERTDRPRMLLVTQFYRPEPIGSAPYCADLAEWLTAAGWDVRVLAGLPHYPSPDLFPEYRDPPKREVMHGVVVERLRSALPKGRGAISRLIAETSFLAAGVWALASGRVEKTDIVVSLCPSLFTVMLGSLAKKRGGRHVAIIHDVQSGLAGGLGMGGGWMVKTLRFLERMAFNNADEVAVLTPEMGARLREIGVTAPISLMPIWVDSERCAGREAQATTNPRILYSGNFGKKQGMPQVLALAEELEKLRPELRLLLRGEGSQAPALKAEIAERGIGNTRVEPLLPADRLYDGLAEGDIHLVPQAPEAADFALPSKLFNIMAVGRPIVATARPGGPLWRISQESGALICVPPDDRHAFAQAVLRLVDDPELRAQLASRGRAFIASHHARELVLGNFCESLVDAAPL